MLVLDGKCHPTNFKILFYLWHFVCPFHSNGNFATWHRNASKSVQPNPSRGVHGPNADRGVAVAVRVVCVNEMSRRERERVGGQKVRVNK